MGSQLFVGNQEVSVESYQSLFTIKDQVAGLSKMQGSRKRMEDYSLMDSIELDKGNSVSIYAIFDGHGGEYISRFVVDNFVTAVKYNILLVKDKNFSCQNECISCTCQSTTDIFSENYVQIISKAHSDLDRLLLSKEGSIAFERLFKGQSKNLRLHPSSFKHPCLISCNLSLAYSMGTTAICAFILNRFIVISNLGDSIAYLYNKGGSIIKLNREHKPSFEEERNRILKSGSCVTNSRINGIMNISRSLGDFRFKDNQKLRKSSQSVISAPEVEMFKFDDSAEFVVLASDGFWNNADYKESCRHISGQLKQNINISEIARQMQDIVIAKNHKLMRETDNMTCIIIKLK